MKKTTPHHTAPIQNRIVGHGEEAPDQLLANPKNWRIHPETQQQGVTAVLECVGWVQSVIVNKRTGFLVDGHLRVSLALRRSEPTIPVSYVDLSDEEEALVLATLDPLAGLASTDREGLAAILEETKSDADGSVLKLLDQISQDAGLFVPPPPTLEDLAEEHGEHDPSTFWPVLKMKLPPETFERYESMMRSIPGKDDAEKFEALLQRVNLA